MALNPFSQPRSNPYIAYFALFLSLSLPISRIYEEIENVAMWNKNTIITQTKTKRE